MLLCSKDIKGGFMLKKIKIKNKIFPMMMILSLILLILNFLNESYGGTIVIKECHNGGVDKDQPDPGETPRRPIPSATACHDNDQSGLCNILFPNADIANSVDP